MHGNIYHYLNRLKSKLNVGLLANNEYRGFFHACQRIFAEEGAIAFYRGYLAYILAVSIQKTYFPQITFWMSILPQATDFMMLSMPMLGGEKD